MKPDGTAGNVNVLMTLLEPLATATDAGKAAGISGKKKERAKAVGVAIGKKLQQLNVKAVVFDRNGFIYHGRVKELADGAREAGLEF